MRLYRILRERKSRLLLVLLDCSLVFVGRLCLITVVLTVAGTQTGVCQTFLTHKRNRALSCRGQPACLDRGCSTRVY